MKIFFLRVLGPARVGFHTSFGDGSQIPESHLEHLRDVVWRNLVFNRWEQGDIVMIDNFRISHGRQVGLRQCSFLPLLPPSQLEALSIAVRLIILDLSVPICVPAAIFRWTEDCCGLVPA